MNDGPGKVSAAEVGRYTVAKTTLLDARRVMAYAAGINDINPAYFDDEHLDGLRVHPAIAFSLQWNARFVIDRPANLRAARFGVHAETDLQIFLPFTPGEAVTTQGRLIARKQIKPGVFSVDRYRMTNSRGELIAQLDYNGIIRGATLEGDDTQIESVEPRPSRKTFPEKISWQGEIPVALHAAQQYTECADIYNPIHTEPSVAHAAGLPGPILHGSATKALALTCIVNQCFDGHPERIRRLYGQLRAMVLLGSTISVQILDIVQNGIEKQVFFQVMNALGEPALSNGIIVGLSEGEDS